MKLSTRHGIAAIVAASCLAIPGTVSAMPYSPPTTTSSDAAQSGGDGKANSSIQPPRPAPRPVQRGHSSEGGQTGSSIQPNPGGKFNSTFPAADFRGGDSPVDHPGASRAQPTPTTIEVIRPERTIVRDVDQALPIALAGSALALVLALLGVTLVRTRLVPRPSRSH
jgi:hypothetical protein